MINQEAALKEIETGRMPHDRRRYPRALSDAPGEIILNGWWPRRLRLPLHVRDVSATGMGLRVSPLDPLRTASRAAVRWDIPSAMSPSGSPIRLRVTGTLLPRGDSGSCGFRFDRLLDEQLREHQARRRKLMAALTAAALAAAISILKTRNIISFWYDPFWQTYSMLAGFYVLSRIAYAWFYKEPEDHGIIKPATVVLPIMNEERHIEAVIRRLFQARYPAEMLEVIAIDDGSTDGTWAALQRLAVEFPRLQIHRFQSHKGKRHAMALGAQKAAGEILIFMDSDSLVAAESFYRLVQPFHDSRVGAVAGHTSIIIEPANFISKMEAVRYFISQRVMKAAESIFGAVNCCPGPLSAYRREAVLAVLDEWLNQRFLGAEATFGDDRSLTNRILRHYRVVYHSGARCSTYAPNTWAAFLKQQLRWKKSWVRETLCTARIMAREHPLAAAPYYASILLTLMSPLVVLRVFLYSPWVMGGAAYLPYLAGLMLVFLLFGVLYYYHTQSRYWYYGLVFAVVYSWLLSLQTYYAILTVRQNHWGTR
ncbi:MAG TPA: family 2 glycosyl transferase [Elusimicrobia bacterium]|nr:family 2 glycosyl transferase [Elusimicrobiota bacterium]HBT61399.1 family 2 glycosyl transferase [Elusimicrobiota bacterium]